MWWTEEDPDYNFDPCIEKSIVKKVGCQSFWNKYNMKGIDICNNGTGMLLSDFLEPSLVVENKVKHGRRLPDVASSNENMRKLEV